MNDSIIMSGGTPSLFKPSFVQIADKVLSNSNVETTIINSSGAKGSLVIPANTLKVGSIIRMKMDGIFNATGTPTGTIKIYLGGTTLVTSAATLSAFSGYFLEAEYLLTIRTIGATGTVCGQGKSFVKQPDTLTAGVFRDLRMTTDVTINTTVNNTINVTYQFSVASSSNSLTTRNLLIEIA